MVAFLSPNSKKANGRHTQIRTIQGGCILKDTYKDVGTYIVKPQESFSYLELAASGERRVCRTACLEIIAFC